MIRATAVAFKPCASLNQAVRQMAPASERDTPNAFLLPEDKLLAAAAPGLLACDCKGLPEVRSLLWSTQRLRPEDGPQWNVTFLLAGDESRSVTLAAGAEDTWEANVSRVIAAVSPQRKIKFAVIQSPFSGDQNKMQSPF